MHHVEAYIIFSHADAILQNVMYILTHHQKKVKFSFAPLTRFASLHTFVFLNQICACLLKVLRLVITGFFYW